jgi:hypothetical protein
MGVDVILFSVQSRYLNHKIIRKEEGGKREETGVRREGEKRS